LAKQWKAWSLTNAPAGRPKSLKRDEQFLVLESKKKMLRGDTNKSVTSEDIFGTIKRGPTSVSDHDVPDPNRQF
jgi:hypothetical protein